MEIFETRLAGRTVLVVDVVSSVDGDGIGYGIILKRIDKVLWAARVMDADLFYIREAPSINTAVFRLRCEGVEILPRGGWRAWWLRGLWAATAPFRHGSPRLWLLSLVAQTLLGSVYETMTTSAAVPRALRRFIARPHPVYRWLKRANDAYAQRKGEAWKRTLKPVDQELRKSERAASPISRRLWLPEAGERQALAAAAVHGLGPQDRLVTVHVREHGYRSAAGLRQRPLDLLRNARIETYEAAFSALVERGYKVVRLGDRTMTPVNQRGVIDLAMQPKSEWLEAWCILRSEFLVGCDSGPSWLAVLLGVPVLTVNALHFRDITRPADRFICKLVRERATGHTLTLSEMLTETFLRSGLDTDTYEHLDNEPADLRDAALDMIEVVHGREEMSLSQRRFNQRLTELGSVVARDWTSLQAIGSIRRPKGAIARRFAKKYWQPRTQADGLVRQ